MQNETNFKQSFGDNTSVNAAFENFDNWGCPYTEIASLLQLEWCFIVFSIFSISNAIYFLSFFLSFFFLDGGKERGCSGLRTYSLLTPYRPISIRRIPVALITHFVGDCLFSISISLHKICENTGFNIKILSLYGRKRVTENLYCAFSYARNWELVKSIVGTKFRRSHLFVYILKQEIDYDS